MGEAKQRRNAGYVNEFAVKSAKILEFELCYPGPLGGQSKEWLCATLPNVDDLQIAAKALGAPVTKFTTTWDRAPIDVYLVENYQNVPPEMRTINTDATLAWHQYLLDRKYSLAQIHQEPPIVGPSVARYAKQWDKVTFRHTREDAIVEAWFMKKHSRKPLVKKRNGGGYDIYVSDKRDASLLREVFHDLRRPAEAA
jgi:hypothetical protein